MPATLSRRPSSPPFAPDRRHRRTPGRSVVAEKQLGKLPEIVRASPPFPAQPRSNLYSIRPPYPMPTLGGGVELRRSQETSPP